MLFVFGLALVQDLFACSTRSIALRNIHHIGLILFLSAMLMGCSGGDDSGGITDTNLQGKWVITESMGAASVSDRNWMEFNPGGELVQASMGTQSNGTWTLTGDELTTVTLADPNDPDDFDMTLSYTINSLDGNRMVMSMGGAEMVLERR
ncbi:MAG: hypothetical protein MK074_01675 [Phycisphaerales bacterium]|nr:hypothetical protein [Phycisphaerales bacterium]